MLTYLPLENRPTEARHEYPWLLILLVFAWLWPGVFSHDLWNPAEPQVYTVITESKTIWLPTLFGEAYFSVSPIYLWLANSLHYLFVPTVMDSYPAMRVASVVFTVIGLLGSGIASAKMVGNRLGRSTVLILIGSAGLLSMAHFLSPMSVAFAGVGLAMWGLAIVDRQAILSSFLLGLSMIFLGQSLGLIMALGVFLVGFFLSFHGLWRNMRLNIVGLGAMVWAIPILSLQPLILAKINPQALDIYLHQHLFGAFGGWNHIQLAWNGDYYLKHLLWFAFPAYPLAMWTAWRTNLWRKKFGALCVIWLAVFGLILLFNPQDFQDNLIILLPVLAILGSAQLDCLRRGAAAFLNWFGMMTFSLAAIFLWVGFFAMNYGFPAKLAERAAYFSPYYVREIDTMPMIVAILFTPAWIIAITRKRIRGRQAVTNWAAGMTLVWALLLTLFLPWLDAAKSYRPIVEQMQNKIKELNLNSNTDVNCVYIAPEFQAAKIAWQEYSSLKLVFHKPHECTYQLIQFNPKNQVPPKENVIWHGKRPRNKVEAFVLVKLVKTTSYSSLK